MKNVQEQIIYVGKAKDLKRRLASYFRENIANSRTYSLVKNITHIETTIVHTEAEALLLESNLIKKHQPRYNVLLRDDKSYPYIFLSAHEYPRLSFHRGSKRRKGQYFGPYPSAGAVRESLNLLQKLFKLRQCEDSYFSNRSRPCLQYQIKRCLAPCTKEMTDEEHLRGVEHTIKFLQGSSQDVIDDLVKQMDQAAEQLHYEKAAENRDLIEQLRQISQQQTIIHGNKNVDVIALEYASSVACVQVQSIRNGSNLGSKSYFPKLPKLQVSPEINVSLLEDDQTQFFADIMLAFLSQYYLNRDAPDELLVSHLPTDKDILLDVLSTKRGKKVLFKSNLRGVRNKWLQMSQKNALYALKTKLTSKAGYEQRLVELQKQLSLEYLPERMECFDISHTMGEATVASCVVFGSEGAMKDQYRRYNINNITAGDDYAAMRQALVRRFKRFADLGNADGKQIDKGQLKQQAKLPDILFIDGGKGQVTQAIEVLEDCQISGVDVVGITKGEKRKASLDFLTIGKKRIYLDSHSLALNLIQQIRDEAHRFAIAGHRQRRQKARTISPLEEVSGLGPKRRQLLLKQFGGIRAISGASIEELCKVKGISRKLAEQIYDMFH